MKWLKKISIKFKLLLLGVSTILFILFYLTTLSKMRARDTLDYELKKLKAEIELEKLNSDKDQVNTKLVALEKKEEVLQKKIKLLEEIEIEKGEPVSLEELDTFFDERGY